MQLTRHPGHFDTRFARHLWGLTRIYWTSPDVPNGGALLALCVAGELGLVYANVRLAWANSRVFNAVQKQNWPACSKTAAMHNSSLRRPTFQIRVSPEQG